MHIQQNQSDKANNATTEHKTNDATTQRKNHQPYKTKQGQQPTIQAKQRPIAAKHTPVPTQHTPVQRVSSQGNSEELQDDFIIKDPDGLVKQYEAGLQVKIKMLQQFIDEGKVPAGNGNKLLKFYKEQIKNIKKLKKSKQVYKVFAATGVEGGVSYDQTTGNINVGIGTDIKQIEGLIAHELEHAMQYERGETSFNVLDATKRGTLYDLTDETNAYNQERKMNAGMMYFQNPDKYKWDNEDVKKFSKEKMAQDYYKDLPEKPESLKSSGGKALRKRTIEAGKNGSKAPEVYKGWQKDYAKGVKKGKKKK